MARPNLIDEIMSESIEMYLLRIALLQRGNGLVPISQLAQELEISPVSAHEMCRKLTERDLIRYEPYKGVTLSHSGATIARHILRRRRLWEVFLVNSLGFSPDKAETIACQLEHAGTDELAEKMAAHLGNPTLSPQGESIPAADGSLQERPACSLAALAVGEQGRVVSISADKFTADYLRAQGIRPGVLLTVTATASDGSALLALNGHTLSLTAAVAEQISVTISN